MFQFTSFNTEQGADFVQVYVGSIVEMNAVPVASLSGQPITNQIFRSHNNMMFIKFSSDSQGNERGFTAVFGSGKYRKILGPVVQSIISLTSSLRVIWLTVLADSIYNILIFFAEKM